MTLALAGMVMVVRHKCRDERNFLGGNGLLDEAEDDARLVRHHADLADESAAKAQAARVDGDIAAFRDRARRKDAAPHTSETAHLRELLDDRTDRPA